jgi:hypothetical protein
MSLSWHVRECLKSALPWLIALMVGSCVLLGGCSSTQGIGRLMPWNWGKSSDPPPSSTTGLLANALWPLSAVGGLACFSGVLMLVLTRGSRGWLPIAVGVGLCVVNGLASAYLTTTWFLVLVAVSGVLSLGVVLMNVGWLNKNKGNGAWKIPGSPTTSQSDGPPPESSPESSSVSASVE